MYTIKKLIVTIAVIFCTSCSNTKPPENMVLQERVYSLDFSALQVCSAKKDELIETMSPKYPISVISYIEGQKNSFKGLFLLIETYMYGEKISHEVIPENEISNEGHIHDGYVNDTRYYTGFKIIEGQLVVLSNYCKTFTRKKESMI